MNYKKDRVYSLIKIKSKFMHAESDVNSYLFDILNLNKSITEDAVGY